MKTAYALSALLLVLAPAYAGPVGQPYRGPIELLGSGGSGEGVDEQAPVVDNPTNEGGAEGTPNQQPTPNVDSSKRSGTVAKLDGAILWSWYWEHNKDRWIARATERGRVAAGSAYYWFGAGAKFPPREIVPVSINQRVEIWRALRTRINPRQEKSAAVRAEACIAIGRLRDVPMEDKDRKEGLSDNWVVRDLIWVLANEPDPIVRRNAILGLGVCGHPDAGGYLMKEFGALRNEEKPYALIALGLARHLPAIPMLLSHVPTTATKATDEQLAAIHAIGLMGPAAVADLNKEGRGGVAKIATLVRPRGDGPTVMQAVATLGRLQQERAVVEKAVRSSKSINIEWTSLLALASYTLDEKEATAAAKALQANATRGKGQSRNFAIFALGDLASRLDVNSRVRTSILSFLRSKALDTKNNYIRACGAIALGMARDSTSTDAIAELLSDSTVDDYVVGAACVALGLLRATDHADTIVNSVLTKWNADARGYALLGLALIGDTTRMPDIRRYASLSQPTETNRQVTLAIGVLGDRDDVRRLASFFSRTWKSKEIWAASNAAFGLGWIKDEGAVGQLTRTATTHSEESVRAMAAIALGYCGMPERTSPLARCYENLSYRNGFGGWKILQTIASIL